jgi:hypothetical protein
MAETKRLLERAQVHAPRAEFELQDVRVRRELREKRRRVGATALGLGVTAALVVGFVTVGGGLGSPGSQVADGGDLPSLSRVPPPLQEGQYAYQRLRLSTECEDQVASEPTGGCDKVQLRLEAWWALDDSGRIAVLEERAYGFSREGRHGPGQFPDEGDLSAFPTEPETLEAFLLDRAGPDGPSPRPEVTPSPGVPLDEGLLWNSVHAYLGSTQYLNVTPALRVAMLRVLADVPMVDVQAGALDPAGRDATKLSFHAYGADVEVFADPHTGDFLAMTERYSGQGTTRVTLMEAAGFASDVASTPEANDRTIPTAA